MSFTLEPGRDARRSLGESGSGKSVTAQAIMGILRHAGGSRSRRVRSARGEDLLTLPAEAAPQDAGPAIAMVFQDALTSLNPVFTVGEQIAELLPRAPRHRAAESPERAVEHDASACGSRRAAERARATRTSSPAACASAS